MTGVSQVLVNYEKEYDNRGRVADSAMIMQRWSAAAADYRQSATASLDTPYGGSAKQAYDIFHARPDKSEAVPLVVYIHGGYWQRGDRKDYSFVASALNERGIDVVIPSYTLCPVVPVSAIIAQLRTFLGMLWQKTPRHPVIVGHSAGGHLAAALLATNWQALTDVPADLVRSAYSLSGVFDLSPLIDTSLNTALQLDSETARAASPLFWQPPPPSARIVAAVGGLESTEFLRQSLDLADIWGRAGVKAECVVVPSCNHFTIVDTLTRAESAMVMRIAEMASASVAT